MIKHIVMWKFKENTPKEQAEFLNGLKALYGVIDEIKSMEIGVSIKKDSQYDAALTATFDSMEDLKNYKINPKHVAVSSLCKSIRTDRTSLDYEF